MSVKRGDGVAGAAGVWWCMQKSVGESEALAVGRCRGQRRRLSGVSGHEVTRGEGAGDVKRWSE